MANRLTGIDKNQRVIIHWNTEGELKKRRGDDEKKEQMRIACRFLRRRRWHYLEDYERQWYRIRERIEDRRSIEDNRVLL